MKRKIAKVLTMILALSMLLGIGGCSEKKTASKNLTAMFDTLKKGDYYEAVSTYIYNNENSNDFLKCGDNFNKESFAAYDIHNALFSSLEYKIIDTEIVNQSEIHFNVEISSIDLSPIGEELAATAAAYNASAENAEDIEKLSDTELNSIMTQQLGSISSDYLSRNDKTTVKNNVEVTMGYTEDGRWLVSMTDDLYNALTGGVYKAFYEVLEDYDVTHK